MPCPLLEHEKSLSSAELTNVVFSSTKEDLDACSSCLHSTQNKKKHSVSIACSTYLPEK